MIGKSLREIEFLKYLKYCLDKKYLSYRYKFHSEVNSSYNKLLRAGFKKAISFLYNKYDIPSGFSDSRYACTIQFPQPLALTKFKPISKELDESQQGDQLNFLGEFENVKNLKKTYHELHNITRSLPTGEVSPYGSNGIQIRLSTSTAYEQIIIIEKIFEFQNEY